MVLGRVFTALGVPLLRCHFPNEAAAMPAPLFEAMTSGRVSSAELRAFAAEAMSPKPVRKPSRPVRMQARVGEQTGRQLVKVGAGTLALSGDNSYTGATTVAEGTVILSGNNASATGGMTLNAGITRFDSPASINGTGENVTANAGATLSFGGSLGDVNIPSALDRIVTTSAGVIAADYYESTSFNFSSPNPGLSAAFLGAVGNVPYTGALTPECTA
jgi:autotransporter-associated beta strand protein